MWTILAAQRGEARQHLHAALILALTASLACGGSTDKPEMPDPNDPDAALTDTLRFNYTAGTTVGSFSAKGEFRFTPNKTPVQTTMATAWVNFDDPALIRVIGQQIDASVVQAVSINFYDVPPGESVQFSAPESEPIDACRYKFCIGLTFLLGSVPSGPAGDYISYQRTCQLTSGSVQRTASPTGRLQGVFSGAGTCWNYTSESEEPFALSNGTFDLAEEAQILPRDFMALVAPPGLLPSGLLTFNYQTYGLATNYAGRFTGQGAPQWNRYQETAPKAGTWAYGNPPSFTITEGNHYVMAKQAQGAEGFNDAYIGIYKQSSNNDFTVGCYGPNCAVLSFDIVNPTTGVHAYSCFLVEGSLRLMRLNRTRMSGTFSADSGSVFVERCQLSNGSFDVPLVLAYDPPF